MFMSRLSLVWRAITVASFSVTAFCVGADAQTPLSPQASPPQVFTTTVPSQAQVLQAAQASFAEYFQLLALPNDAVVAADIQKNTDFLQQSFNRRGFTTQQLANNGKPLLYAEYRSPAPDAKTLLFYMHLDGQPVLPEQWAQPSPWLAEVKKRNAQGQWQAVDSALLQHQPLDPELRVFARAQRQTIKARS